MSAVPDRSRTLAPAPSVWCYAVDAVSEPGILPRLMDLLAKRDLVPARWHADRAGSRRDGLLTVDIQVDELDQPAAEYLAARMRQIVGVAAVLMSEKRVAPAQRRA
jgi:hypothetical protein